MGGHAARHGPVGLRQVHRTPGRRGIGEVARQRGGEVGLELAGELLRSGEGGAEPAYVLGSMPANQSRPASVTVS